MPRYPRTILVSTAPPSGEPPLPIGTVVRHRCPIPSLGHVVGRRATGSPVVRWYAGPLKGIEGAAKRSAVKVVSVPGRPMAKEVAA